MIRSLYTNNQLKKIPKYRKLMIHRSYNLLILTFLYVYMTASSILMVKQTPIAGMVYFLLFSFVFYIVVAVHNRSFYGLNTPIKLYQERILTQVNNNLNKCPFLGLMNTLFLTVLLYVLVVQNLVVVIGFAVVTFGLQVILIDIDDVAKITKIGNKFEVDVSEYRILDNDIFESLTKEQIFYVYSQREQLVASFAFTKDLTANQFRNQLDHEEYILVTMLANQMEQLGK